MATASSSMTRVFLWKRYLLGQAAGRTRRCAGYRQNAPIRRSLPTWAVERNRKGLARQRQSKPEKEAGIGLLWPSHQSYGRDRGLILAPCDTSSAAIRLTRWTE